MISWLLLLDYFDVPIMTTLTWIIDPALAFLTYLLWVHVHAVTWLLLHDYFDLPIVTTYHGLAWLFWHGFSDLKDCDLTTVTWLNMTWSFLLKLLWLFFIDLPIVTCDYYFNFELCWYDLVIIITCIWVGFCLPSVCLLL
jgi:hypothetical protein